MMRIATWNVRGTTRAWRHVVDALPADIILLQECRAPADNLPADIYRQHSRYIAWERNGDKVGKGIAIYTRGLPIFSVTFQQHQGWAQVVDVTLREGIVVRLINVYGELKKTYFVTDTLNQILADLFPLMSDHDYLLLGGDLNVSILYGEVYKNPRHRAFLARLSDEYGLVNCTALYFQPEPRTNRGQQGGRLCKPYQNDYIFASRALADRLTRVQIVDDSAVQEISDHNAVVATFAMD